jgi:hypothetical protein
VHNTDYTISLLFEDVLGRTIEKVIGTERTLGTGSMFYSINVTQDEHGTVVTAKLLPTPGDWTVFISETELVIDTVGVNTAQAQSVTGSGEDIEQVFEAYSSGYVYLVHENHVQTVQF